jgi:hypothetical protein
MDNVIKAEYFPWLNDRKNSDAKPTYKIIARSMSLSGDSIVMLHKAGNDNVINYYIRDLIAQKEILQQMDEKEAKLLCWVVESELTDPLQLIRKL